MHAQYVQFTENKGQWNSRVLFAGDAGNTGFFLEKNGYRVLLNDSDDISTINQYFGGHPATTATSKQTKSQAVINASKKGTGVVPDLILHSHAYEVTFLGSAENPKILPDKMVPTFSNYFIGNDRSKWSSNCKIYQALLYQNIYPGVDVRYYTSNSQLKYDIIVNPGADISKIALGFAGADGLSVKNGNLIVKTSVGNVMELAPKAYQVVNNVRTNVDVKFYVSDSTVYFKTANYAKTSALVIDPALVFSSFTGSKSDNWGYTATYDAAGNFYAGGICFGPGYPTSLGAFQQNFAGGSGSGGSGFDVAIIKLSHDGVNRVFATYLGGTGNEQPHSMVVDNNGSLIVAGRTTSTDFPVTQTGIGPGGLTDIFITKFTPDGSGLVASEKIGGAGNDGINEADKEAITGANSTPIRRNYGDDARSEVIVDSYNNIYLASCTQSNDTTEANLLSTPDAFQRQFSGGMQDGLLVKTDPSLHVLFSSYLGGNGDDAAFVLALNPGTNDIYVGGATTSNNLAATGNNAGPILYNSFQAGACDGFVSIISNDGSTLKNTVYVGGPGNDMLYGLGFDKLGYPYIMGTTTISFPVLNAAFNSQAKGKQFITKLAPDLSSVEYSTNFGKGLANPDLSPVAFLVDRCENVYVSGWGGGIDADESYPNAGTSGLTTTPDAIQSQTNGKNFYFFVLKKNGESQLYGSFFGELTPPTAANPAGPLGDHVDGGTSRFDAQGVIYQAICANCGKTGNGVGFPTTLNVWANRNISQVEPSCNEAAVKIAFQLAGVTAGIRTTINGIPNDTSGCIPLTVAFTDTIGIAKQYIWNFGDGSQLVDTTSKTILHTFTNVGVYTVQLIAVDSSACNIFDTVYLHIRARNDYAQVGFNAVKLPPCDSLKYAFVNISVPPVGKPFGAQSFQWNLGDGTLLTTNADTIIHSYAAPGTYTVSLLLTDTNYCNSPDTDTLQLRIATNVKAAFTVAPGCAPENAGFNNISEGGQQFVWNFGDGSSSTLTSPQHLYSKPGTYTVTLSATDSSTCNKTDSTSQTLVLGPKPTAAFTFTPTQPEENTPTTFLNGSQGGTTFVWNFGDGSTLATNQLDTTVTHQYNTTGTFNVCLAVSNEFGCSDTACSTVQTIIVPLADVPNAFTPNGDGINDVVYVRGFGIDKMDWKIYNRWGVMIFQSTSPEIGWNGYYKGTLQPQEVYTYLLDIKFANGLTYRKKGDITLLR